MKLTEKENLLLRRALDAASSSAESEAAAKAFISSLRKRGVSGYDFVPPDRQARAQAQPEPEPNPERAYWADPQWVPPGWAGFTKPRQSTPPPPPPRRSQSSPPPPPKTESKEAQPGQTPPRPRPQYSDPKWDFIRQQRKTRQQESTAHERPPFETRVQREAREQRAEFMGDIHSEYMDRNRKLARNGLYTFRAGATLLGLLALCTGHPIIWLAFIGVWIYCGCAWFYYKHQAKKFSER